MCTADTNSVIVLRLNCDKLHFSTKGPSPLNLSQAYLLRMCSVHQTKFLNHFTPFLCKFIYLFYITISFLNNDHYKFIKVKSRSPPFQPTKIQCQKIYKKTLASYLNRLSAHHKF